MVRHRTRGGRDEGFTLIELMVVVVVLGALVGLILLAVDGFQQSANDAVDKADEDTCRTVEAAAQISGRAEGDFAPDCVP